VAGVFAAAAFELLRVTTRPPVGAAPLIETVPVTTFVELPWTLVGLIASDTSVVGCTVRTAVCETDANLAVIVAGVEVDTAAVLTEKVAEDEPAATTTVVGGVAHLELLDRLTLTPPLAAALLSVTVPIDETPPITGLGFKPIEIREGGEIVSEEVLVTEPAAATMVAFVDTDTGVVFTVTDTDDLPVSTTTE